MRGVLCGRRTVVIVCGLLQGLVAFSIDLTLIILGLGFLRARLLRLCVPLFSLKSFYNYARGHCEAAQSIFRAMHSVHLISIEQ